MKRFTKFLGIAALFAVIVFLALPLTGCPEESEDTVSPPPPPDYTVTIDDLAGWLDERDTNTPEEPYVIKLIGNDISSIKSILSTAGKYVYLDLSDIEINTIGDYAFQNCTSLTGITIPNIREIARFT